MKGERHKHHHFDLDVNATESTENGLASVTGIEINIPHQTSRSFQHDDDDNDDFATGMENAARELQKLQLAQRRGRQPETVQEAYYNDGATELFLALEDTEWRRALLLIENDPDQVYCWVVSMGSLDTTTNWSIWRRLPLHEACRRQAPAWLISALLSVYPGAAQECTQFGELPLHLAVECGSPPEVVNLLVVAHWHGILKTDQSGRTPRAILLDSDGMLDLEDHKVVYESLLRSEDTYQIILQQHEQQVKTLQQRHASGILAMEQDHAADLKRQAEKYSKLQEQLKRSQMLLRASELSDTHNVEKLQEQDRQAAIWQERVENLQEDLSQQICEMEEEQEMVRHLQQVLQQKNEHIEQLQNQVATLQGDLQSVVAWNDQVLQKKVQQTETKLQLFVREFLQLRDLQGERGENVKDLLTMRDIPIPVPPPPPKKKKEKEDEKKMEDDPNLDEDVVDQDAMDQAAAAACSALNYK